MKKWFKDPNHQMWIHRILKYFWLAVAVFSLTPWGIAIRSSLAMIFFISVYANYVSHWSAERAIDAQLEQRNNK